ncbi:hypothetical protein BH24PSE2_BH24PSE2_15970 [soil metagenome]
MKTRIPVFLGLMLSLGLAHAGPDPVAPMQEIPGSGNVPAAGDSVFGPKGEIRNVTSNHDIRLSSGRVADSSQKLPASVNINSR